MSAGIAKVGAFIGVFLFPLLNHALGLSGTLTLTCALAVVGALLTLVLPEPSGRSLEEVSGEEEDGRAVHRPSLPRAGGASAAGAAG
jgi:hypothetical protein